MGTSPGPGATAMSHHSAAPWVLRRVDAVPGDLPRPLRVVLGIAARIEHGELIVQLPDGRRLEFGAPGPGPSAVLVVRDPGFALRLVRQGDLGMAEAYLRGEWDSPDLPVLLRLLAANRSAIGTLLPRRPLLRLREALHGALNRNTRARARRNIRAHYDLGNRFYAAWLDRTMTYSAALFDPADDDLTRAQERKYSRLADAVGLAPGLHVLEIGCGWGGFAEYLVRDRGCRVTGLTISREQHAFAQARLAASGLDDRAEVVLRDYRDERGVYDAVVSIEMFEAVGEAYWPAYFEQLRDRIRPGGRAGLQVITIRDDKLAAYRREIDFIRRYVFPGGMLPSLEALDRLGRAAGLHRREEFAFGLDYARTICAWRERFRAAWPNLSGEGFDERFRRLWEYYLAYCEAGFRSGNIDVRQIVYERP
jgi:cyclopropane-fatty-acyl-phospholipid synthase